MHGAGTRRCTCRPSGRAPPARRASSGPRTRPTCPTARSSGWPGSTRCRRPASTSRAFRSGSWVGAPGLRASSRSSGTDVSNMLGATVAGYRIEAVAGRGGMGVVYRARQLALDRTVALKLIAPELARDDAFRARFERESRIAASLDHPNVIPVYEAGSDGDRLFIAMRFVDGTDLGRMLAADGALDPRLAAELIAQAGSALDAAPARGLVHRDVKPANLLVTGAESSRPHVSLTDFGLARRDGSSTALTTTGQWMGTPDYAAPEQIDGYDLTGAADVYALGCVLFAALAGQPPFGDRPRMAKAAAHVHEEPPTLRSVSPSVSPAFEPVVARALAKRPADRYASAAELGEAALAAASVRGARGRTARTRRLTRGGSRGRVPVRAPAGATRPTA